MKQTKNNFKMKRLYAITATLFFFPSIFRLWLVTRIIDIVEKYSKFIRNSQRTLTTYCHVGVKCFIEKFTSNHFQLWNKQWKNDGIGYITVDNYDTIGPISFTDTGRSEKAIKWKCDKYASTASWMCNSISKSSVEFATKLYFKWQSHISQ